LCKSRRTSKRRPPLHPARPPPSLTHISTAPWDQRKPTYSHIIAGSTTPVAYRLGVRLFIRRHLRYSKAPITSSDGSKHVVATSRPVSEKLSRQLRGTATEIVAIIHGSTAQRCRLIYSHLYPVPFQSRITDCCNTNEGISPRQCAFELTK